MAKKDEQRPQAEGDVGGAGGGGGSEASKHSVSQPQALRYLDLGWSVVPLWWVENGRCACGGDHDERDTGKHPIIRWTPYQQARPTREEVEAWWGRWPRANIGIVTGAVSGLVILDIDPRHGGDESAPDLGLRDYPTVTAITGGGGWHLYYRHPGVPVPNKVGIAPGVDVRGDGGYVVAPPSIHRSGQRYVWESGYEPSEHPIASLPNGLLERILRGGEPAEDFDLQEILRHGVPEGERNVTMARIAGHFLGKGHDPLAVLSRCLDINRRHFLPPLGSDEVVKVVSSIWKKERDGREGSQTRKRRRPQATELVELALATAQLWHTPSGEAFATVEHHHLRIRDSAFSAWLAREFFRRHGRTPSRDALTVARDTLAAHARFEGPQHEVFVRVGEADGHIYVDLADGSGHAVEITPKGWAVVPQPGVRFWRPQGLQALPCPQQGDQDDLIGALDVFRLDEEERELVIGFLVACLHPRGPYPILLILGEAGSGKSTLARMIVDLIDPRAAPLRAPPRDERDLLIAARRAWLLAFTNLGSLPPWASDALCRLATDAGFATRRLYTDDEEEVFEGRRPVILNAIADIVGDARRADLADRTLTVRLAPIADRDRRPEGDILSAFHRVRPRALGALYTRVARALADRGHVSLPALPRLADVAVWVSASEPPEQRGAFVASLQGLRLSEARDIVTGHPVGRALWDWVATWSPGDHVRLGSSELYRRLTEMARQGDLLPKGWPGSPAALGAILARLTPPLRRLGIDLCRTRSGEGRLWRITKVGHEERVEAAAGLEEVEEV